MKKSLRFLSLLLALCMTLSLLPAAAFAASSDVIYIGGEKLSDGQSTADGKATWDADTHTLTLNGYTYLGSGSEHSGGHYGLWYDGTETLNLVLSGDSRIEFKETPYGGTYIAFFSKGSINVTGGGQLTCIGGSGNNVTCTYGIQTEGDIVVKNATLWGEAGCPANYPSSGIISYGVVADNITVSADGWLLGYCGAVVDSAVREATGIYAKGNVKVSGMLNAYGSWGTALKKSTGLKADGNVEIADDALVQLYGFYAESSAESLIRALAAKSLTMKGGKLICDATGNNADKLTGSIYGIQVAEKISVSGGKVTSNVSVHDSSMGTGIVQEKAHAIYCKDYAQTGGTVTGTVAPLYARKGYAFETAGVYAVNSLTVSGGTLTGNGGALKEDETNNTAMHNSYGLRGSAVEISGGTVTGNGGDHISQYVTGSMTYGIYAQETFVLNNGSVRAIGGSKERKGSRGMYADEVNINGGEIVMQGRPYSSMQNPALGRPITYGSGISVLLSYGSDESDLVESGLPLEEVVGNRYTVYNYLRIVVKKLTEISDITPSVAGYRVTVNASISPAPAGETVAVGLYNGDALAYSTFTTVGQDGTVTAVFDGVTPNTYTAKVQYAGSDDYIASQAVSSAFTVAYVMITPTLTLSTPAVSGNQVTVTATLGNTDAVVPPTGQIKFVIVAKDDSVVSGTKSVTVDANGAATHTFALSTTGEHEVRAQYLGDERYNASSEERISGFTVGMGITISAGTDTMYQGGSNSSIVAAVTGGTDKKALTWSISGSTSSGTRIVSADRTGGNGNAVATLYIGADEAADSITVTATANADPNVSASLVFTVLKRPEVTITTAQETVEQGGTLQLAASVTNHNGNDTVTWSIPIEEHAAYASIDRNSGLLTVAENAPVGLNINVYAASGEYQSATDNRILTVTADPDSTKLDPGLAVAVAVDEYTAKITATLPDDAEGTVTFRLGAANKVGPFEVKNGKAEYTFTDLSKSTYSITVEYSGNDIYMPASRTERFSVDSPITIAITPKTADVVPGRTQQFAADVQGLADDDAIWSVSPANYATITKTGGLLRVYPETPAGTTLTITAHPEGYSNITDTATVTVGNAVSVTIDPAAPSVMQGGTVRFTATVANADDESVTWSLYGNTNAGTSIDENGVLTVSASETAGAEELEITATSNEDSTKFATAKVNVQETMYVTISPETTTVPKGQTLQFTANVVGYTSDATVTWEKDGAWCSIDSETGLLTVDSKANPGSTIKVTATSKENPKKSATATVIVTDSSLTDTTLTIEPPVVNGFTVSITAVVDPAAATGEVRFERYSKSGRDMDDGREVTLNGTTRRATVTYTLDNNYGTYYVTAKYMGDAKHNPSSVVKSDLFTLSQDIRVNGITPALAEVPWGGTQTFTASVTGTTNTAVRWSISGAGTNTAIGSNGVLTVGADEPVGTTFTIRATSLANESRYAEALVTVAAKTPEMTLTPSIVADDVVLTAALPADVSGTVRFRILNPDGTVYLESADRAIDQGIASSSFQNLDAGDYTAVAEFKSAEPKYKNTSATCKVPISVLVRLYPATAEVQQGGSLIFTANVTGASPIYGVRWEISGTGGQLSANTTVSDGVLTVGADETVGNDLTVTQKTEVSIDPTSASVEQGRTQQFKAMVNGAESDAICWSVIGSRSLYTRVDANGLLTVGADETAQTLTVKAALESDPTKYATAIVTVSMKPAAPTITDPTEDQTVVVPVGETAKLSVTAEGATSYQWYVDRGSGRFEKIDGATTASYESFPVTIENNGYSYYCKATNSVGSKNSPLFTLQVVENEVIPPTGDDTPLLLTALLMGVGLIGFALLKKREEDAV